MIAATAPASAATDCSAGAAGPSPRALDSGARDQRRQIAILHGEMNELGCGSSIVAVGSAAGARCDELGSLMDRMQANLTGIEEQRATLSSAPPVPSRPAVRPCAVNTVPIPGVSQFLNPPPAGVEDLSPRHRATIQGTMPDDANSIMQIELAPAAAVRSDGGGDPDTAPALNVEAEPPSARPMTEHDRDVRKVGPRFLPDPGQSLHLERNTGNGRR